LHATQKLTELGICYQQNDLVILCSLTSNRSKFIDDMIEHSILKKLIFQRATISRVRNRDRIGDEEGKVGKKG